MAKIESLDYFSSFFPFSCFRRVAYRRTLGTIYEIPQDTLTWSFPCFVQRAKTTSVLICPYKPGQYPLAARTYDNSSPLSFISSPSPFFPRRRAVPRCGSIRERLDSIVRANKHFLPKDCVGYKLYIDVARLGFRSSRFFSFGSSHSKFLSVHL